MPQLPSKKPAEPVKPLPEQFGLTTERLEKLEHGYDIPNAIGCLFLLGVWLSLALATVRIALGEFSLGKFPFMSAILLGGPSLVVTWLFCRLVLRAAEPVWQAHQPDAEEYRCYKQAEAKHEDSLADYRRKLNRWWRAQEEWWCSLSGPQFERELGALLRKRGWKVQFIGASGDGGVDLVIDSVNETFLVQCKAHRGPIGPGPVRELYGVLNHRGGGAAWLVSTAGFTSGAKEFARHKPIRLVTIQEILREQSHSA